jgi:enoyl-[acyl-carrier protein] reductase III
MEITLEKWDTAVDSQAKAFLVGVREAARLMRECGRIIAITFAPGGRFGSWQPWVAMGAAKAAMEVLTRYFAVALAGRGITVNTISPGWIEDSVLNSLPSVVQDGIRDWHKSGWGRGCFAHGRAPSAGHSAGGAKSGEGRVTELSDSASSGVANARNAA